MDGTKSLSAPCAPRNRPLVNISDEEENIILRTKKSLIFSNGQVWEKKGRKPFDVTMGSWDGAEVADLVGLYLLFLLKDLKLHDRAEIEQYSENKS